jgi:hypothetical protein
MNETSPAAHRDERQRHGRRVLLLMALIFLGPIALAVVLYATDAWRPSGSVRHGELLKAAAPLPPLELPPAAGDSGRPGAHLRGRWSLIYFGPGACEGPCAERVRAMRQVRLALGKEMARVQRIFCVTDGSAPAGDLIAGNAGLIIVTDGTTIGAIGRGLGERADGDIFVVDPLGNPVLRFPAATPMRDVHQDLQHLLKSSEIG